MLKKLVQIGSSWGVIIPKATLELLKINPILDKVVIIANSDEIIIIRKQK